MSTTSGTSWHIINCNRADDGFGNLIPVAGELFRTAFIWVFEGQFNGQVWFIGNPYHFTGH